MRHLSNALELGLTQNDSEFDSNFYIQPQGMAMGKKCAPAYVNSYMADREQTVFPKCPKLPLFLFCLQAQSLS